MDHEKGQYGGIFQNSSHPSSNGISDLINEQRMYDDDAEIEAAAAQSETPMPIVVSQYSNNSSLKPLHVQVNGFNGPGSEPSSSGTKSTPTETAFPYFPYAKARSSNNSMGRPRDLIANKPSTSAASSSNVLMGPPSASSSVLLSPAGNLHNGYSRSSGESSPLSPATFQSQRSQTRRDSSAHPLATSNMITSSIKSLTNPPHRPVGSTFSANQSSVPSPNVTKKEIEMGKRKAVSEKIRKLRDEGLLTAFIPQIDTTTDTQMAVYMKKYRYDSSRDLPQQIRNEVFDEKFEDVDRVTILAKRIRFSDVMRIRDNNPDDVTDISDNEEEESILTRIKRDDMGPYKVQFDKFKWNERKMRIGVQLAKTSMLIEERHNMLRAIRYQMDNLRKSSGCRFEGEEPQPRKRRIVDGQIYLFDNSVFKPSRAENFGCARARPLISWTKRKLRRNIFSDSSSSFLFDPTQPGCSTSDEKLPKYDNKNIAIGSQKVVTKFASGVDPDRETMEYEYCSYEDGKGMIEVGELAHNRVVDFVTPKDFRPIENRLMSYLYRLSTAPAMITRKSFHRSTLLETGMDEKNRNGACRQMIVKERKESKDRKKEKKVEEVSSDEDDWVPKAGSSKGSTVKKKGRGRPSRAPKKPARAAPVRTPRSKSGYGFDDYFIDEPFGVTLPPNTTYARINVPSWEKLAEDVWKIEECPSNSLDESDGQSSYSDDLRITVSKDHHKLMFLEKERFKKIAKKIRPNKSGPARVQMRKDDAGSMDDEEEMLERLPPFDMKQFESPIVSPIRRFASVERPFPKREFPLKSPR